MRGVKRDDVKRGMIVAKPGTLKQYDRFKAQIYMMTKEEGGREKPLVNNIQVRNSKINGSYLNEVSNYFSQLAAFSKTWDCATYITIGEGKELCMPGEDGTILCRLVKPQVLEMGQTFTLRDGSNTVGTGKVRCFFYI